MFYPGAEFDFSVAMEFKKVRLFHHVLSSGLPSVVPFVPFGAFGRSFLSPLRHPLGDQWIQER